MTCSPQLLNSYSYECEGRRRICWNKIVIQCKQYDILHLNKLALNVWKISLHQAVIDDNTIISGLLSKLTLVEGQETIVSIQTLINKIELSDKLYFDFCACKSQFKTSKLCIGGLSTMHLIH